MKTGVVWLSDGIIFIHISTSSACHQGRHQSGRSFFLTRQPSFGRAASNGDEIS
jgi:hypothetical protein